MPVFRSGAGQAPEWCELESFEIVTVAAGLSHVFERAGRKEKLIVVDGRCRVAVGEKAEDAETGTKFSLDGPDGAFRVDEVSEDAKLVRLSGRWGDETGPIGIFPVRNEDDPDNKRSRPGDTGDYPKTTTFDNHYHDCDEYWVIVEGNGIVVSEGKSYEVGPGDCVATGMGHHHDFPQVFDPVRGVYFETTLERGKRRGHLWNHTHGQAQPVPERV